MSTDRDVTRIVRSWLDEGVTQLPDRVLDLVLDQVPSTPQRRSSWLARRFPPMNTYLKVGLAAAVVVLAGFIGFQLLGGPGVGSEGPSPSVVPSEPATVSAEPSAPADGSLPVGSSHVLWDGSTRPMPWNGESSLGIRIVVTIPASGWFGDEGEGVLTKDNNADAPDGAAVTVFARTNDLFVGTGDVRVFGDPCHWASTLPDRPVTTVDEAVAALSAQPSRNATEPVDITYDGHAGKYLTLRVPDGLALSDCDGGEYRTLLEGRTDLLPMDGPRLSERDPGQIDLLTILNVNGEVVIFDVAYHEGTPGSVLDEIAGIVTAATLDYQP